MATRVVTPWQSKGIALITPAHGRQIFAHLVRSRQGQIGVLPYERRRIPETIPARLHFDAAAYARASAEERQEMVVSLLRTMLATVGGFEMSQLTADQDLLSLGFDSLMALEMRDQIERLFAVRIPLSSLLLEGESIQTIGQFITEKFSGQVVDSPPPPDLPLSVTEVPPVLPVPENLQPQGDPSSKRRRGKL